MRKNLGRLKGRAIHFTAISVLSLFLSSYSHNGLAKNQQEKSEGPAGLVIDCSTSCYIMGILHRDGFGLEFTETHGDEGYSISAARAFIGHLSSDSKIKKGGGVYEVVNSKSGCNPFESDLQLRQIGECLSALLVGEVPAGNSLEVEGYYMARRWLYSFPVYFVPCLLVLFYLMGWVLTSGYRTVELAVRLRRVTAGLCLLAFIFSLLVQSGGGIRVPLYIVVVLASPVIIELLNMFSSVIQRVARRY